MLEQIVRAMRELHRLYPTAAHRASGLHDVANMLIGSLIVGALFWVLESLWPEDAAQKKSRRDSRIDAFYWFFDYFVGRPLGALAAGVVAISLILFKVPYAPSFITHQPLWFQAIGALLVADFCSYWAHRLLHQVPVLWRIHAVHHSSTQLNWLASARVHPLEGMFTRAVSTAPLFLLGFKPQVSALAAALLTLYPIFIHANVPWDFGWLRWLIASPAFHRWHHASDIEALDKNYAALFPALDYLFGTAYFPRARHPRHYGLYQQTMPASIARQLMYPFRHS